ncbi:MAG: hypothetical protein AAGA74_04715 [Pseudomonadota bacterium]
MVKKTSISVFAGGAFLSAMGLAADTLPSNAMAPSWDNALRASPPAVSFKTPETLQVALSDLPRQIYYATRADLVPVAPPNKKEPSAARAGAHRADGARTGNSREEQGREIAPAQ